MRVVRPLPSKRHALSGLWKADYGAANGIQIVCVGMDFSGPVARIVAMKVTHHPSAAQPASAALPTRGPCCEAGLHELGLLATPAAFLGLAQPSAQPSQWWCIALCCKPCCLNDVG